MRKSTLEGISKQHVLSALADLDGGMSHPFGAPTGYELIHEGKRYPPKAAAGLAVKHLTGRILSPEDFSGGEAPGQANSVLRNLGFKVVRKYAIGGLDTNGFVTSKSFALPTDAAEMADRVWFNMWQRRLWPYSELEERDTLYWYDTTKQAIVWHSRVARVERFEYANKEEVRRRFKAIFDLSDLNDAYFDVAIDRGYCLSYKVDSLVQCSFPKPSHYQFPQSGWLRCGDENVQEWLKNLPAAALSDGPAAEELSKTVDLVAQSGYFSPSSLHDEREKKLREIVERRGQPDFRSRLIAAYGGVCAVTGCDAVAALEAAHLVPYCGPQSNHVTNGLLLRADVHTLFDLDLIGIDPETLTLTVAPAIQMTTYAELEGRKLVPPSASSDVPNNEALAQRWQRFKVHE